MQKVNYNRLVQLWLCLVQKTEFTQYVSQNDISRFLKRVEGENLTFLTTTLPRLGKAMLRSFETGRLGPVLGFRVAKGKGYPQFLQDAWKVIYEDDGTLLPEEQIDAGAVVCIRQLTEAFYKLKVPHTQEQERAVIATFIEDEESLRDLDLTLDELQPLLDRAQRAVKWFLQGEKPLVERPRHGSGASACGLKPHLRYGSFRYISRLDAEVPYEDHFFYNRNHYNSCEGIKWWMLREDCDPAAQIVFVPKDSRGPRMISKEPREFMYAQQGYMSQLYGLADETQPIAEQLDFTNQVRNQVLAQRASLEKDVATIDCRAASDLISLDLVKRIFPLEWVAAFQASRSLGTTLPDGTYVPLAKFAPMGSALCFPVEAICFWAIAHAALDDTLFLQRALSGKLRQNDRVLSVFGDDIICEREYALDIGNALESVGLAINYDKSFINGSFKESCGGDYFNGRDVSIVRFNHPIDDDKDASMRFRAFDLMNNLIMKYGSEEQFREAVYALAREWYGQHAVTLDSSWHLDVPSSREGTTRLFAHEPLFWTYLGLGHHKAVCPHGAATLLASVTEVPKGLRRRYNEHLQVFEVRLPCEMPIEHELDGNDWGQLLRKTLQGSKERTSHVWSPARRTVNKWCWIDMVGLPYQNDTMLLQNVAYYRELKESKQLAREAMVDEVSDRLWG